MFVGDNSGDVHRTGLFGSVKFEAIEQPSGTVDVSLGIADPVPLLVLFAAFTVWVAASLVLARALRARRHRLLAEQHGHDDVTSPV